MNDIFDRNSLYMKEYRGALWDVINKEYAQRDEFGIEIDNEIAFDGEVVSVVKVDNKTIRLNSIYSPDNEATIWADNCFENNPFKRIIIMYGLGSGYFAKKIIERMENSAVLFIYDPFVNLFMNTMNNYDITSIIMDPRVYLYVGEKAFFDFKEMYDDKTGFFNIRKTTECKHPGYEKIDERKYQFFWDKIVKYKSEMYSNIKTNECLGKEFVGNRIYTMKHLNGCNLVEDVYKIDKKKCTTAIVVAAGPSLSKNVLELKKAKGKAFILCVDTALKTLLANDIIPDAMVSFDPHKPMNNFADERCLGLPLFCCTNSSIELQKLHYGKKIYVTASEFDNNIFGMINNYIKKMMVGGSVATGALSICINCGFDNIVFVGQDLAYGDDGTTHADNVKEKSLYNSKDEILIDGINGGKVYTRNDWRMYLIQIEEMIERNKSIRFINATEGGANIKGTKVMTLAQLCEKISCDVCEWDKELVEICPTVGEKEYGIISDIVAEMIIDLNRYKDIYQELKRCNDDIIEKLTNDIELEDIDLTEYGYYIDMANGLKCSQLLYTYGMNEVSQYVDICNEDMGNRKDTCISHFKNEIKLFEVLQNVVSEIRELLIKKD